MSTASDLGLARPSRGSPSCDPRACRPPRPCGARSQTPGRPSSSPCELVRALHLAHLAVAAWAACASPSTSPSFSSSGVNSAIGDLPSVQRDGAGLPIDQPEQPARDLHLALRLGQRLPAGRDLVDHLQRGAPAYPRSCRASASTPPGSCAAPRLPPSQYSLTSFSASVLDGGRGPLSSRSRSSGMPLRFLGRPPLFALAVANSFVNPFEVGHPCAGRPARAPRWGA